MDIELEELLKRRNVDDDKRAQIQAILSSEQSTVIDAIDRTPYDSPVQLSSMKTWVPIEQKPTVVPEASESWIPTEQEPSSLSESSQTWVPNEKQDIESLPSLRQLSRLGRYDDLGVLGVGGMGEVRKIQDLELNRTLAMKIIHQNMLTKNTITSRFIEEAQVGAQLQHPNIVPIHELGELANGRLYFTMKEVKGHPLGKAIKEVHQAIVNDRWKSTKSGWSFRKLIDAFHKVCSAIAYAHSKGVLHRDLKPENIMIGEYGEVLVVDWGIAKVLGRRDYAAEAGELDSVQTDRFEAGNNATRMGQVAGTPAYMSPEQARGDIDKLDGRTDIYALGVILYEILTGKPAYIGTSSLHVLEQVLSGPPSVDTNHQFTVLTRYLSFQEG